MKNSILKPMLDDENVIVQFTEEFVLNGNTKIKVPNGFVAVVFIDERVAFKVDVCVDEKIVDGKKCEKKDIGKQCRIAFMRTKPLPPMLWGFGNIQVNNKGLKEAYQVGANGTYTIKVPDDAAIKNLIKAFYPESNVTTKHQVKIDDIRRRTLSVLKTIGNSVLGNYFANTSISVFEIAKYTVDIRETMLDKLSKEEAFQNLGVGLADLTVDGIHVNAEDLQRIRGRING